MNVLRPLHNAFIRHSVQAKRDLACPVPDTGESRGCLIILDSPSTSLRVVSLSNHGFRRNDKIAGFMQFCNGLDLAKRNGEGFTLLEVMVALSVIAIVLVSLLVSQSHSISLQDEAKFNTTAALLAQKKISEIEAKKGDDLMSDSGDFGDDFPNYFWEIKIQDVSFPGAEEFTKYLRQIDLNIYRGEKRHYQYAIRLYKFVP